MASPTSLITLAPELEQLLQPAASPQAGSAMPIEPNLAEQIRASWPSLLSALKRGRPVVLVVPPALRTWITWWLRPAIERLHVLSFNEIPDNKQLVATLGDGMATASP